MKKIIGAASIALLMGSCTIAHEITVTNNPVGTKKGVAKGTNFSKDLDLSAEAACKNGGITKIGTMEFKVKQIIILTKFQLVVTGE